MTDKPTDKKSNIVAIVKSAQPVNQAGEPDRFADRRIGLLGIENYLLVKYHPARDQSGKSKGNEQAAPLRTEITIPLFLNGVALIESEIVTDDGIIENRYFVIIGKTSTGKLLPPIKVPVNQFPSMNWVFQWGNRLVYAPGNGNKDNARAAIQTLSGDVATSFVYRHTGWRELDGRWHYLTGSGAVTETILDEQVTVELDSGHMQRYRLPAPPEDIRQSAGFATGLLNLAPNNPAVGVVLLCAVARAPLAELAPIDFSLFLAGRSGSGKSECAALALAFFGDFTARSFPANFTDTESDIQIKAHQAKDSVFVVDDFCPSTNQVEANKLHAKAENLFRAVGNQSGRGRRNTDMSGKAAYFPRGMVVATGEDLPRGASLLGRLLIVELKRGDLDWQHVTQLQAYARSGWFAKNMGVYAQWLAPRMESLKIDFPKKLLKFREEALADGFAASHPRAADIYASLLAGLDVYLDFLLDIEAIGDVRADHLYQGAMANLKAVIRAQAEYQENTDEVEVFRNLLQSCFASGDVHISCHLRQGPPFKTPHALGWRARTEGGELEGHGSRIGWINELNNELWLEPEKAFSIVKRLSDSQGEPFLISKATLWRRLLERNVLKCVENNTKTGKARPDVKRTVNGISYRVLVFPVTFIIVADV